MSDRLREAIRHLETVDALHIPGAETHKILMALQALRAALAEPKAEPVSGVALTPDGPALIKRGTEREWVASNGGELLYTHPPEQRWIPVTERLPEKHIEVLVCFAGQLSIASTGQYTGSPKDKGGWCYPAENNGICDDGSDPVVTHWMPLPVVPGGAA